MKKFSATNTKSFRRMAILAIALGLCAVAGTASLGVSHAADKKIGGLAPDKGKFSKSW